MTSIFIPPNRPKLTRADLALWFPASVNLKTVYIVGIRGYYANMIGRPNVNDIGAYDDAIIVVSPTTFRTFNANTDPSRFERAINPAGKAQLNPGQYRYRVGVHKAGQPGEHLALIQATPVSVSRLSASGRVINPNHKGMFGINIHRGGTTTTGSEGCQTIPPGQWGEFIQTVRGQLSQLQQKYIIYYLIDNPSLERQG